MTGLSPVVRSDNRNKYSCKVTTSFALSMRYFDLKYILTDVISLSPARCDTAAGSTVSREETVYQLFCILHCLSVKDSLQQNNAYHNGVLFPQ